jgi:MFS transporter, DHA1 family, inner membrane transport protein
VVRRQVPGGARAAFRIDLAAMLLAGLYTGAVFPFVSVIAREDLDASPQILALMGAAPFLGNLMALFVARAMEGKSAVPFVKWSHLTARSTLLLVLFVSTPLGFAVVLSLVQVIGTIATPAYASIIKDVYPDEQRGRILSLTRAAILFAQVATTLLAGWLMDHLHFSYRYIFASAALVGIASALVFSRIKPDANAQPEAGSVGGEPSPAEEHRGSVFHNLRETGRFVWSTLFILREDLAYRWFALSVFMYGFGNLLTVPIIPLIQVDEMHIAKGELGILVNITQVVAIGSYFYWGRFVDRRGPQRAVVVNVLINALVPVIYILTGAFHHPTAWMLLPAYIISGIVGAGIDLSYFNAILTFSGPGEVSRYQALHSFLLGIRGTVAPCIGAVLAIELPKWGLNLRWAFALGIVFMLCGAWMQGVAMRRQEARKLSLDRG